MQSKSSAKQQEDEYSRAVGIVASVKALANVNIALRGRRQVRKILNNVGNPPTHPVKRSPRSKFSSFLFFFILRAQARAKGGRYASAKSQPSGDISVVTRVLLHLA